MNNHVKVRPATVSDTIDIASFNKSMAMETESLELAIEVLEPGVRGLFSRPEYGFYLMAVIDNRVVGSLMVTYEWSDWRNGVVWWLQSVYVVPEARRSGVFKALYESVEAQAKAASDVRGIRLYVERENTRAQQTYTSLGMEETHYFMYEAMFDRS